MSSRAVSAVIMSRRVEIFSSVSSVYLVPGSGFRVGDGGAAAAAEAVAAEGQDVWFCSASAKSPRCTDGAWGTASEKRAKSNVVTSPGKGEQR